ncbi:Porin [Rubrivivax sp. A210]|uniref:porin n=1 Tax=Rubrivivax sp. A210 TaxID=2772301 RepID=UPI001918ECF9|nr:porin [Rubrivivax sp. A210]CAD5372786.1 Porin [Rubrivivax sp. A210]
MHKTLITLALAGAVAAPALAQGSLTVFGIADLAVRSVTNDGPGTMKSLVSGSSSTSRLGFRGVEDLGGGLSAGFHLEHGILLDIGTAASATQFFDRRATVSLASTTLGELRAGRDYMPTYTVWTRHDPFSYVGVAGSNNLVNATPTGPIRSAFGSNPNTAVRSSNAIEYLLPAGLGGLEGGVLLAAGEGGAVASGLAKVVSVRLGYAAGPFGVAVATASSKNSQTSGGAFKDNTVAARYDAGLVRLAVAWREFKQATATQTNTLLAAVVPLGASELKLSYNKADMGGRVGTTRIEANGASQIGLGYVYNLSKRTSLYASYSRLDNEGTANFVIPGGPAGLRAGGTSTGYEAGLRHNF